MPLKVDIDKLESWLEQNFASVKVYRKDYLVNSIFAEDTRHKLSISPSKQCYHCWKTDESGPLWRLVMKVDSCSKREALEAVYEKDSIRSFTSKIDDLKQKVDQSLPASPQKRKKTDLPLEFRPVVKDLSIGEMNTRCLQYCLLKRQIDPVKWGFGYCETGKYAGRLIVPYRKDGEVIYWNARSLRGQEPKYMNPPADEPEDIQKQDVLFTSNWSFEDRRVIIVEGAFDAISLIELGFHAVAIQGKTLGGKQLEYLRKSILIFGLDNDKEGQKALTWNSEMLREEGITRVEHVFPPLKNGDWNSCFCKWDAERLRSYINSNIKPLRLKDELLYRFKNKSRKKR